MTEHVHLELVDGCYRCDLNRDELPPEHECNAGDFDRVECACGCMHSYCDVCGDQADVCELD
jgi:hypothetical protein